MNPACGLIILLAVQTTYGWWSQNNDYSARTNAPYCDFRSEIRWDRTDCGYPGSIKSWCESRGCCWDPVYKDGANWCFCPNKDVETSAGHDELRRKRQRPGVHVTKTVTNNCVCSGTEISKGGPGPRPFHVHCWKVKKETIATCNKKGKNTCIAINNSIVDTCLKRSKRQTKQIKCSYKGNPHDCRAYNKNNNQPQFYEQLLDAIAPVLCMQLNLENPECPNQTFNTARLCSEIDYKFEYQFEK